MDNIKLKGGRMHLSLSSDNTYIVRGGTVLVYIVPLEDNKPLRRSFIYEAEKGEELPSFRYTDYMDRKWTLGFTALENAELEVIPNGMTDALRDEFARKAKIYSYDNEGFEDGLVEQYELNIITEDGFIHKTGREQKQAYENSLNIIYDLFRKKHHSTDAGDGNNPMYIAASYVCRYENITIAPIEKVYEGCRNKITIPDIARLSHFMCRKITLPDDWYRANYGSFIAFEEETGMPYACIPKGTSGYYIYNPVTGEKHIADSSSVSKMRADAYMVYRPFGDSRMGLKELIAFSFGGIKALDILFISLLTLAGTLIGLLIPTLYQKIFDNYIPIGSSDTIVQISCVILSCLFGNIIFMVVRELIAFRIESRVKYDAQNAAYDRLFNLPESFFREYDSADTARRVMSVSSFMGTVTEIISGALLSAVFSFVYLFRMISYSGSLSFASVIMLLVYASVMLAASSIMMKYSKKSMEYEGKADSMMYQLISGISKIRTAGIEDRALYEYLKPYTGECSANMSKEKAALFMNTFSAAIAGVFSLVLYYIMNKDANISMGTFIAFVSAFGFFSSAMLKGLDGLIKIFDLKTVYRRLQPILENAPEYDEYKELPGELKGDIEINNITFSYSRDDEPIVSNLSFHIREGEYIGIVGPSGCGKSTLLKLLLGFEKPLKGKIYYDGKDLETLDKIELRKKMGVVLQNGKLITGSIYENITITSPDADVNLVKETIREVGLGDDIDKMPMGIHTLVSETSTSISGGQRQRILIARAIASRPKIVFFDEATSELDNITQSMICDNLDKLNSTRVVIAHRLSTVINCDRIIVLSNGGIEEEGTYDELMEKRGYFYHMADRQIM